MITIKTVFKINVTWDDVVDTFLIPFASLKEAEQWIKIHQVEEDSTIERTKFLQFSDNTGSFYVPVWQRNLAEKYLREHPCGNAICNATTESLDRDYVDFSLPPYHERDDKGVFTFSPDWEKIYV